MSVQDLINYPKNTVGTGMASQILECDRYALNVMAKAGSLPFDFFFSGNRLHISKASLLRYLGYNPDGSMISR